MLWKAILPIAALHLGLSLWSMAQPERLLLGDRAGSRLQSVEALLSAPDTAATLIEHGWPGDYAFHALLYAAGGPPLVLVVQLLAFLSSVVLVYGAARQLSVDRRIAALGMLAFAILPSSLHHPHTMVTEAFFVPVVAGFVYLALQAERSRVLTWPTALGLGVLAAMATSLRPMFLPVLPLVTGVLLVLRVRGIGPLLATNLVALLPVVGWAAFLQVHEEPFALGATHATLGYNLSGRMERMARLSQETLPAGVVPEASLTEFLAYSVTHPMAYLRTMASDTLMLFGNPGVNHTYGRFLHVFAMEESSTYWAVTVEKYGVFYALTELLNRSGVRVAINAIGVLSWMGFGLLALVGAGRMLGSRKGAVLLLGTFFGSLTGVLFLARNVRWSQRSCLEVVLTISFTLGVGAVVLAVQRRHALVHRLRGWVRPQAT